MDQYIFMGMLVIALGTLVGLFSAIYKPLSKINESLIKLRDSIDALKEAQTKLEARVGLHGKEIEANTLHLSMHDKDIEQLKKGGE